MSKRDQAQKFVQRVGLELKGRIVSQGFTAQRVATSIGRSPAAFNRWLNGKADIPLAVLYSACETISVDPAQIVTAAWTHTLKRPTSAGRIQIIDEETDDQAIVLTREPQQWRERDQR